MYPFSEEGIFAARNQWYVAAWSHEVDRSLLSRWILNEPVVLYRTENNAAIAVHGRCPHRHFPLGESRLVGDNIECGYHGFTFSPTGKCTKIPTQDAIPDKCRINSYPVVERWKWVWIWMGDPALADESLIPDHSDLFLEDPDYVSVPAFYLDIPGRYQLLNDNLLDLSHLSYLHQSSIGSEEMASATEVRQDTENWLSSKRSAKNIPCPPLYSPLLNYKGNVDRYFGMDFYMPGLHVGFDEFRYPDGHEKSGELIGRMNVYHIVTPGKLKTTNYFFAFGSTFAKTDSVIQDLLKGLEPVLKEDAFATEAIEAMLNDLGEVPPEFLARGDAHAVRGRRILEALIKKEIDQTSAR